MPRFLLLSLLGGLGLAACGDPNFLNPPNFPNGTTSVRLWAIQGTPIHLPSAWSISGANRIRLDQSPNFDFAFDITPDGRPILLPQGIFGLLQQSGNPGFIRTEIPWDDIDFALINGYLVNDTIAIAVGDRFYARSGSIALCFSSLPFYAKMQIMEIDSEERTVLFRILSNLNCGYKALEEGLPTR